MTWRHPSGGVLGRILDLVARSRAIKSIGRVLPSLAMTSDVRDVIYINYLVEASELERHVPVPLELQRLGPGGRHGLFTFLTYRHGHFGPTCFGALRVLWASPIQSNWRVYVRDPRTGMAGVRFVTTAITSVPHALAARTLVHGLEMHVPRAAHVRCDANGGIDLLLDPGAGSSPDVAASFRECSPPELEGGWRECFGTWRAMLEYCVPQDRALCPIPESTAVSRQEIVLDIPLEACVPLEGKVESSTARAIVGDARAVCFRVPSVRFRFLGESIDR
ncbi:MAG: DUF2071 domain-containing protein [Phycisphaerales bacterium]